ncbi:LnmK family bifunctional acyltransferase/decarboxylase [Streptomyces lavendulae]|uniref:LnmK family bifunctional acyltransferase/decarboxylase n=1 Tax=Streptomyces lavendulae TaxID=1914 RepID=UPI0033C92403
MSWPAPAPAGQTAGRQPPAVRQVTVTPSMCGRQSLLAARVGDWTWHDISRHSGMDVLTARTDDGDPAYLAFSYIRIKGSTGLHPLGLAFGDRLTVTTQSYAAGPATTWTLHQLAPHTERAGDGGAVDPDAYFRDPDPGILYVENVNRWVRRTTPATNTGLTTAVPTPFRHHTMDRLPGHLLPQNRLRTARQAHTLLSPRARQHQPLGTYTLPYTIDAARDLNGVGLVYFASYLSIADTAVHAYWQHLGRSTDSFTTRQVTDSRICYLANTDAGSTLSITVTGYPHPHGELLDIQLHDHHNNTPVAIHSQLITTHHT